jgi:hypothetical protein
MGRLAKTSMGTVSADPSPEHSRRHWEHTPSETSLRLRRREYA